MEIYCAGCGGNVDARLTDGSEIYPHRKDLADIPFWKCDTCGNYVGCHHKTDERTRPLGIIPTKELRAARGHIHALIDPLWKSGRIKRGKIYAMMSDQIGHGYHTANIKTIEEAREIYRIARSVAASVNDV